MENQIGLFKIFIEDDIFNEEKFSKLEISEIKSVFNEENVVFLDFKLESSTIEDFLDYLEFADLNKCYIVTNTYSLRLSNIVELIKEELEIDISIQIYNDIEDKKLKNITFDFPKSSYITLQQRLNNSYVLYNSGFYTFSEKINIKHIFIDNLDDIKELDDSLLKNCSINSLIITTETDWKSLYDKNVFSKIIYYKDLLQSSNINMLFESFTFDEVKKLLEIYINSGKIESHPHLIKDLGKFLKNKKIHSLFIKEGEIYFDSEFNMLLSKDLSSNIFEILNNLTTLTVFQDFPDSLIVDYYLGSMLKLSNENIQRNISKYTNYNIKSDFTSDYNEYNNWLGYVTQKKFYLYNKISNRTFEVNEKFMDIYEYLAKSDEVNLNTIDEKLLKEAKELLHNGEY